MHSVIGLLQVELILFVLMQQKREERTGSKTSPKAFSVFTGSS